MPPDIYLMLREIQADLRAIRAGIRHIKARLDEIWTWGQRAALMAAIWAGGIVLNLTAEEKAALIAALFQK